MLGIIPLISSTHILLDGIVNRVRVKQLTNVNGALKRKRCPVYLFLQAPFPKVRERFYDGSVCWVHVLQTNKHDFRLVFVLIVETQV